MPSPFAPPKNPVPDGWWSSGDSLPEINYRADMTEQEEYRRHDSALGRLLDAQTRTESALTKGLDADLLFSRASDATGARAKQNMNALRGSLGARGLNPNSGAASGLLSRLAMQQENELIGGKLNAEIEAQKSRQIGAATNFNNILNLAQFEASPVPQIGLDARQNSAEMGMRMQSERRADEAQRRANRTQILGSLIGAGTSILGGLI